MSETTNLKLKKHDNVTTNTSQFDIENYMNGNWDKVDEFAGQVKQEQTTQNTNIQKNTTDIANKVNKTDYDKAMLALQAELLKAQEENARLRKDNEAGTLEGQAEGESLYLQDSSDARFREFGIGGNSRQEKREGYNKFDIQKWLDNDLNVAHGTENSKSKDKISLTATEADCFTNTYAMSQAISNNQQLINKFGTEVKPDTAYTIYLDKNNTETDTLYAFFCDADYNYISLKNKTSVNNYNILNFTTPENAKYLTFRLGIVNVDKTIEFSNIMILEGTYTKETIPKFEQYGAMPSLEFPSETQAVGQDVNIFDKNQFIHGSWNSGSNTRIVAFVKNVKKGESYTIKRYNSKYNFSCGISSHNTRNDNATNSDDTGWKTVDKYTITASKDGYLYMQIKNVTDAEINPTMITNSDFKLVKGTEINGYSSYNCGSANVTVCSKNKLDFSKWNNATASHGTIEQVENGIKLTATANDCYTDTFAYKFQGTLNKDKIEYYGFIAKPNTKYTFSCKVSNVTVSKRLSMFFSDKDYNIISSAVSATSALTATTPENCKYITVRIGVTNTGDSLTFTDLQAEEGDATDYIAHEEQTLTMPVQQEMLEGDYFDLDNEEEVHIWGKLIVDGTEVWSSNITSDKSIFFINIEGQTISKETVKSNKYIYSEKAWQLIDDGQICTQSNNSYIFIRQDNFKTVGELKTKLQELYNVGNPLTIYYKLEAPTKLPFTDSQKAVAKQIRETLHTYKGGTHVYSTDEISPIFNVRYTVDQKAYIDAQLKPIIQELTGGN